MDGAASAHTLRHTFAWFSLREQPGDLIGLATLLGHRSLDTTSIYGRPAAEQLAAWVEALALNAYPSCPSRRALLVDLAIRSQWLSVEFPGKNVGTPNTAE